jgi:methionine synthase II (cobalamin-independent)
VLAEKSLLQAMGDNTLMIGTDCGLGGRFHPQIARAKLRAYATARRSRARSCGVG